jgi:hypothetical protein
MRKWVTLIETLNLQQVAAEAGQARPDLADAFTKLPPISEWVPVQSSAAWFSHYHFNGNEAFELPFEPRDFVYSPEVEVPIRSTNIKGHYRRGVEKYVRMIEKGVRIPPVTFLFDPSLCQWLLFDGNHRYEAHLLAGAKMINAVFAFPETA